MPLKVPTTTADGQFQEDSFKYSPLEHVRALFTAFFQGLFHASPPGAYHWEENDELSEIYISDENPLKDTVLGQRPGISCTRAPVRFHSLGLDDMMEYDFRTGRKEKSVLVPGTMIVNCVARVPLESERIAWICAENLWLHRELLLQAGFFEIGRQPVIGAPSPAGSIVAADSADEWYATSVSCPYQFYRTSAVTPLNRPILQGINLAIRERLQCISEQNRRIGGHCGPVSSGYAGLPVSVEGFRPPAYAPQASDVYGGTPVAGETAPVLNTVPHPLNPAQRVVVRAARPNCPAVRPPAMGGQTIPIATPTVEESCGSQMVTETSTVKV